MLQGLIEDALQNKFDEMAVEMERWFFAVSIDS